MCSTSFPGQWMCLIKSISQGAVPEDSEISHQKYSTTGASLLLLNHDVLAALGSQNEPTCHQHLHWLQKSSSLCQTMKPEVLILLSIPLPCIFPPISQCIVYFFPFLPLFSFFPSFFSSWGCFVACQRACDHESCLSTVLNSLVCGGLSDLITKGKTWCWELATL